MDLKKHSAILMNGVIIAVPVIATVYVVVATVLWLDQLALVRLPAVFNTRVVGIQDAGDIPWFLHGAGLLLAIAALYLIGLLTRNWLFEKLFLLAETLVERIPLVKSIYTAIRDMLQLFRSDGRKTDGIPVVLTLEDGKTKMLGMIMREKASTILEDDSDRIAVYLPMSYQIGGFTVFVPKEDVTPLENMTVETLLKVALTGGAGKEEPPKAKVRRQQETPEDKESLEDED